MLSPLNVRNYDESLPQMTFIVLSFGFLSSLSFLIKVKFEVTMHPLSESKSLFMSLKKKSKKKVYPYSEEVLFLLLLHMYTILLYHALREENINNGPVNIL